MARISSVLISSILVITAATLVLPGDGNAFGTIKSAFAQNASNSSDLSGVLPDNTTDFGIPGDNTTTNAANNTSQPQTSSAVPEFGSIAPIILAISAISIIAFSARTRLRF